MSNTIISLKGIKREFNLGDETIYALREINLDICKNEYVALMGPSGSGKSTLMNILGCLDTPSAGQYFLDGKDVSKSTDNELGSSTQ
jgi:putative ABC transport system ATP-binding protein